MCVEKSVVWSVKGICLDRQQSWIRNLRKGPSQARNVFELHMLYIYIYPKSCNLQLMDSLSSLLLDLIIFSRHYNWILRNQLIITIMSSQKKWWKNIIFILSLCYGLWIEKSLFLFRSVYSNRFAKTNFEKTYLAWDATHT